MQDARCSPYTAARFTGITERTNSGLLHAHDEIWMMLCHCSSIEPVCRSSAEARSWRDLSSGAE